MAAAVELRKMRQEDIAQVMEIERECFPIPWHESAYLTEISNRSAYYVVACVREGEAPAEPGVGESEAAAEPGSAEASPSHVVGYAGMWIIMDESHITTLGVEREFRRQRVGEQLLVALLDEAMARGARRATLEVRQSNEGAQNLYRKYDFAPAALRRGYYTDNHENAVVMWIDNMSSAGFRAKYRALKQRLARELRQEAVA